MSPYFLFLFGIHRCLADNNASATVWIHSHEGGGCPMPHPFVVYAFVFLDLVLPFVAPSALTFGSTRIVSKNLGMVGCIEPTSGRSGNTSKDLKMDSLWRPK